MVTCYLGIGSNLGNRRKNIRLAIQKIRTLKNTELLKISGIIESKPMGGPKNQGKFLNAAIKIKTNLTPLLLLKKLKKIEIELGRTKTVHYGPRTIDLDILFYGDRIINKKNLKIPHLKLFEREFVTKSLLEII
jgi:2-amino-4-hydroxy-6-hydroxymethyldihydropteridine diphosphokinase